jgi:alcohol dehydrogenase class IV
MSPTEETVGGVEILGSRLPQAEEMDAYERVLSDAMAGDATLFARQDYVEEAWRIVDPALTVTVSPAVTAATGIDALSHAVEAYTSLNANPLTDLYSLEAIPAEAGCFHASWRRTMTTRERPEYTIINKLLVGKSLYQNDLLVIF